MEDGLLSLKWNNHKSTFFQVLSVLREKHTYTDVTLACDGQLYKAHKFVLSTCSEYFSDIFTSTTGTNIVIVLKDVRRQDLEYLMDYMYLGQVDVAQSELPSLIKTAECLRIKGLAIPDDESHKTQRRGAEEREGSPPPSKKKRYLQEDDRHPAASSSSSSTTITTSTTNNNNNTTITSSSSSSSTSGRLQMEVLPPPPDMGPLVQHLRQVPLPQQPLQAPLPPPPTSQGTSKSHSSQPLSLNLTTQASRTSQGGSSGPHSLTPTSTTPQSSHRPPSSPSHTIPVPVIKEEAADPPETPEGYLNESFEENETKPDVSDPRHLDPDGAVPGPSGLQGSADNWDGDGEMAGYGGGDGYPEGSLEEQGESEVQGSNDATREPRTKRTRRNSDPEDTEPAMRSSCHPPQDSEQVAAAPSLPPVPPKGAKWCAGAAFSMVQKSNIMNLIPMYETGRKKVIQNNNRKPQSREDVEGSAQGTDASADVEEEHEEGGGLTGTPVSNGGREDLDEVARLEPPDRNPSVFGSLSYSPRCIEVNITSYSSVATSSQESARITENHQPSSSSISSSSSTSSSSSFFNCPGDHRHREESCLFHQDMGDDMDGLPRITEVVSIRQDPSSPPPQHRATPPESPLPSHTIIHITPLEKQPPQMPSPSPSLLTSGTLTAPSSPPTQSPSPYLTDARVSPPSSLSPTLSLHQHLPALRTLEVTRPSMSPQPPSVPPPLLPKLWPIQTKPQPKLKMLGPSKKLKPVDCIGFYTTVETNPDAAAATNPRMKSCSVALPKVLACLQCSSVLPNPREFKQHISLCQKMPLIQPTPDHNYCFSSQASS